MVHQVMDRIKMHIASGKYKPGDRVPTEQELSQMFGVGRSSIREAIKIFNYLGVMESKTALGTYICDRSNISREAISWAMLLGKEDLGMVIEFRGALELWPFLLLTERYHRKDPEAVEVIQKLVIVLEKMNKAIEVGDRKTVIETDYEFHDTIIRSAENLLFSDIYEVLRSFLYDAIDISQQEFSSQKQIIHEHRRLYNALRSGDMTKAKNTFYRHIYMVKELLGIPTPLKEEEKGAEAELDHICSAVVVEQKEAVL